MRLNGEKRLLFRVYLKWKEKEGKGEREKEKQNEIANKFLISWLLPFEIRNGISEEEKNHILNEILKLSYLYFNNDELRTPGKSWNLWLKRMRAQKRRVREKLSKEINGEVAQWIVRHADTIITIKVLVGWLRSSTSVRISILSLRISRWLPDRHLYL